MPNITYKREGSLHTKQIKLKKKEVVLSEVHGHRTRAEEMDSQEQPVQNEGLNPDPESPTW